MQKEKKRAQLRRGKYKYMNRRRKERFASHFSGKKKVGQREKIPSGIKK